jgi:integrase
MTTQVLPFGTQIAAVVRDSSASDTAAVQNLNTLADLIKVWKNSPPRELPVLGTTCNLLADYLDKPLEQVTIDAVTETRDGFRKFLEGRKNTENSIRTYVNHVRILLQSASEFGWQYVEKIPEAWRGVLAIAVEQKCDGLARHVARLRKTPGEVTIGDVDQWVTAQQNRTHDWAKAKSSQFWRILRDCGCAGELPNSLLREKNYGIPLANFPPALKREVDEILRWKQAEYSLDRPKGARNRPVTARRLRYLFGALLGFVVNVRGEAPVTSLAQLVQKGIVGGFAEWCINVRKVKGESLQRNLRLLSAAMSQHPTYKSLDIAWLKPLVDSLPMEANSEARKRKAEKFLEYKILEAIPGRIRAGRAAAGTKGKRNVALLDMSELLMRWLPILPWRQRNIREMRIGGPKPNLFRGKIPPFSEIEKPGWVQEEEKKNPEAEFWQFRFSCDETKTGIDVEALLPRQLVTHLEEYLHEFRPHLIRMTDPSTLFVNQAGKSMTQNQVTALVSTLTLRHGGRRVTPHLFRDIVAYTRLKENPNDLLALSKLFWHSNTDQVIKTYGSRFNESSGVCAQEAWLDERAAKRK